MLKEHNEWQVGIKTHSVTETLVLEWASFFFFLLWNSGFTHKYEEVQSSEIKWFMK